ncbi:MAG: hypothetical protein PHH14_00605 [Candidatus Margulisbacteria bacterium]|nr:hypothetical protein [Candidatus Margulisiibacteriota bacterium]
MDTIVSFVLYFYPTIERLYPNKGVDNMGEGNVYFIRHKQDDDFSKGEINRLKEKNKIAIFFDNKPLSEVTIGNTEIHEKYFSDKKAVTVKYRSALNCLLKIAKDGGMVVAEYNDESEVLIGQVKPGTSLEASGKIEVTLQLTKTKTLKYSDYPVALAVRPPYGTICKPLAPFFQTIIPMIYNNAESSININRSLLHPKMLEQMCVEYLRIKGVNDQILKYCILRPGKSLAIIDIAGISRSGKPIYAQVKADKIKPEAHACFIKFASKNFKDALNVIFSESDSTLKKHSEITYVNVDDVFNYFKTNDEEMIRRMIGFPKLATTKPFPLRNERSLSSKGKQMT